MAFLSSVHGSDQAQAITKNLVNTCTGIGGILGREIDELQMIRGVTKPAVVVITCVKEANKRALREGLKRGPVMGNEKLIEYIRVSIGLSAREAVQIIYLDTQRRFIDDDVHFGTIDEVHLYEREVVENAIGRKAASIILAHNHPGGSLEPSEEDKNMTMELASAYQSVNIELLDHILVTDKGHLSFKKNDLL
ncbi:DNA repair protein RadC [Wolbachia pipientis]|uniref:JAB domain-containing protein n=1 Tax=Wolbachia pipientis TaxID=955 RepID=UPI0015FBBCF5|nr:JAB domain-containing protein [Wolbachia pipientis]MBA8757894.1 DNA repair protein RadC [Wolbachia pipientis]